VVKNEEIYYSVHKRSDIDRFSEFEEVNTLSLKVHEYLQKDEIRQQIGKTHALGASSHEIQKIVKDFVLNLGFTSERKGLFAEYDVAGLRPDYFKKVGESGILFEVERGKTNANNMDLLDMWKTHICKQAHHLFLMVPVMRQTATNPKGTKIYMGVDKRIASFFEDEENQINVRSVSIFGY
jgi:hypothetical protein